MSRLSILWLAAACGPSKKDIASWTRDVDPDFNVESSDAKIERGAYLTNTIGACGSCHHSRTAPLVWEKGAKPEDFISFGSTLGGDYWHMAGMAMDIPNITPHKEDGLGNWSDDEIRRAIRDGIRPDGSKLFAFMPIMQYQYISDQDMAAIIAYLRSVAPVEQPRKGETKIPFPISAIWGSMGHDPADSVVHPDESNKEAYGKYLMQIGHCSECHSAAMKHRAPEDDLYLAGAAFAFKEPTGKYPAPSLRLGEGGMPADTTVEDIVHAMKYATRFDGEPMQPPMSLFAEMYRNTSEADLEAIATFMLSMDPVDVKLKPRKLNDDGLAYAERQKERIAKWKADEEAARVAAEEAAKKAEEEAAAAEGDEAVESDVAKDGDSPAEGATE